METMYYIGLDVHKKLISYCVKDAVECMLKARFLPRGTIISSRMLQQ